MSPEKSWSQGGMKTRSPLKNKGLLVFDNHSHSIMAMGMSAEITVEFPGCFGRSPQRNGEQRIEAAFLFHQVIKSALLRNRTVFQRKQASAAAEDVFSLAVGDDHAGAAVQPRNRVQDSETGLRIQGSGCILPGKVV
jgi:hypothetical protein